MKFNNVGEILKINLDDVSEEEERYRDAGKNKEDKPPKNRDRQEK